jgi:MFS family permease
MSAVPRLPERRVVEGLLLATGAMAASTFGTLSFPAIAPIVRDRFDLSTVEVGTFTALVFLGAMVASVPAGRLTDRFGAPAMLAASQAGVAVGVSIAALAPTRLVFLTAIGVAGLAYGAVNPPSNVLVSDAIPRRHRGLMLSLKQTGVPIGGLLASAVLPTIAEAVGWRASLLVPVVVLIAASVLCMTVIRREAEMLEAAGDSVWEGSAEDAAPVPALAPMSVYGFIMAGVQLSFVGYLTIYLVDARDFTPTGAGFALALALAAGVSGRVLWGAASDRYCRSHASSLTLAGLLSMGGLLLLSLDGGVALWAAIFVVGFCAIGWNGVYLALIADRATLRTLGRATGLALMFIYAGVVFVPPLFGLLFESIDSWSGVWLTASGLVLCAALAMGLAPRGLPAHIRSPGRPGDRISRQPPPRPPRPGRPREPG